jgi:hypothetical protein
MSLVQDITLNLELNVEKAYDNARRLETLFFRTLGLMRRIGLPEDISAAVYKIQRLIMVIRMAHTAILAFEAASGPIGWALAIVGISSAALSATDLVFSIGD